MDKMSIVVPDTWIIGFNNIDNEKFRKVFYFNGVPVYGYVPQGLSGPDSNNFIRSIEFN